MTSSEKPEPQGSGPSSTECRLFKANGRHCLTHPYGGHNTDGTCCVCGVTREQLAAPKKPDLRCRCGHYRVAHPGQGACGAYWDACDCKSFACDHTQCGWKPRGEPPKTVLFEKYEEPKPRPCTCGPNEACGDPCTPVPEPPLTPEEEEEAPEDPGHDCGNCEGVDPGNCPFNLPPPEGPEYTPCVCGHIVPEHEPHGGLCFMDECDCVAYRTEPDFELPPQPVRRAPYVATYSVGGHLYEVAVPGDACLQAVDGALVIRHGLGPVAGLVGFQPLTMEEKA